MRLYSAVVIDFDVATFYSPKTLHRRYVGTEGYMAPESEVLEQARKKKKEFPHRGTHTHTSSLCCDH
jgi:serine/threonine protein kinase